MCILRTGFKQYNVFFVRTVSVVFSLAWPSVVQVRSIITEHSLTPIDIWKKLKDVVSG